MNKKGSDMAISPLMVMILKIVALIFILAMIAGMAVYFIRFAGSGFFGG